MSNVKRYNALVRDGHALDRWHSVVLAADYDALAQRCRELEHMLKHARMDADTHYADTLTLRAEVERLERIARYLVRVYIVDDQAYNPEDDTAKALARLKEQIK